MDLFVSLCWLQSQFLYIIKVAPFTSSDDVAVVTAIAMCSAGYLLHGVLWGKPNPYEYKLYERHQEKLGFKAAGRATRNIAEKLKQTNKDVVVFWGSQSGTAEGFANRLVRDLQRRFGIQTMAADLSDFDPESISLIPSTKLAIFIVSTYGEGDPSDNTAEFWNYLHQKPNIKLSNLKYTAFGLGNSNYKYYNRVVEVLTSALDHFGAKPLLPAGRADDSNGTTEEDFLAWKEALFFTIKGEFNVDEKSPDYEPTLSVVEDESLSLIDLNVGEPVRKLRGKKSMVACSPIYPLPLKSCRELSSSSDRTFIHLEFDVSQYPEVRYKTGDHIAIWPINPDSEVDRLMIILGLEKKRDTPISINALDSTTKVKVPTPTTIHTVFQYYLEICSPVSRETIQSLVLFAPTASAKKLLSTLGRDKHMYEKFLLNNHVNLGRLLEYSVQGSKEKWKDIPISLILESLPAMQPRYYSISSSSIVQPRQVALTTVVSDSYINTDRGIERIHGLATNYMFATTSSLSSDLDRPRDHPYGLTYPLNGPDGALQDGKIYAHIRKSQFKLPTSSSSSIIMIAAGTGVAPFRGFLHERSRLKTMGREVGRTILYYGCRRPNEDDLYSDEFSTLKEIMGNNLQIINVFSRENPERKVYVQDRIMEHTDDLFNLLVNEDAYLYICGSAKMARDVTIKIGETLKEMSCWNDVELRSWMEGQKKHGRWQEDVWG
ncbi:putative NADPH-cytochrome P450 reductase [Talaromyces proteolyticus]|uniref:NADPH--cytochrome P450 reductase n=1 Tax=Talaromyces proteolyticus TaxID=1131652 RepID=A0AAD4PS33_9EURO|nr:putative NADPH-cytochrome P450 reductase [Talaromyces proteolyticus]KAH8690310.1 putative NADPH-cytochrome P450 reductase [Talaromyces proteolyticus]